MLYEKYETEVNILQTNETHKNIDCATWKKVICKDLQVNTTLNSHLGILSHPMG